MTRQEIREKQKTLIHIYGGSPKKRGSLEEYFYLLTSRLRAMGWHSIFFFDRMPAEDLRHVFTNCGAELRIGRSTRSRLDCSIIGEFYRIFRSERPEAVNVHFGSTGLNALIAAKLAGVKKRVWTKHSLDAISYRGKLPFQKKVLHTINYEALWTTDILAVSKAVQNELTDHFISNKVQQVYLGINRERFSSGTCPEAKRKEFGVMSGQTVIACISQARPEKGIEFLVRAVAYLKDKVHCPYALIVGGGPLTGEMEKLAGGLGISSKIHFCGVRNDVEDILALSDFTVLPSLEEAAGFALMESLAAGKAVVASRTGGIPEIIKDGVNGTLVEPGDAKGLASAIEGLCADSNVLRNLNFGAAKSSENFDINRGVERTIGLYRSGNN